LQTEIVQNKKKHLMFFTKGEQSGTVSALFSPRSRTLRLRT